jgi:hypothetical protein
MRHLKKFESEQSLYSRIPSNENDEVIDDMEGKVKFEEINKTEFERIKKYLKVKPHLGPHANDYYEWAEEVDIVTFIVRKYFRDVMMEDEWDEYRIYKTDDYYYLVHIIEWVLGDISTERFYRCDTIEGLFQFFKDHNLNR